MGEEVGRCPGEDEEESKHSGGGMEGVEVCGTSVGPVVAFGDVLEEEVVQVVQAAPEGVKRGEVENAPVAEEEGRIVEGG